MISETLKISKILQNIPVALFMGKLITLIYLRDCTTIVQIYDSKVPSQHLTSVPKNLLHLPMGCVVSILNSHALSYINMTREFFFTKFQISRYVGFLLLLIKLMHTNHHVHVITFCLAHHVVTISFNCCLAISSGDTSCLIRFDTMANVFVCVGHSINIYKAI